MSLRNEKDFQMSGTRKAGGSRMLRAIFHERIFFSTRVADRVGASFEVRITRRMCNNETDRVLMDGASKGASDV